LDPPGNHPGTAGPRNPGKTGGFKVVPGSFKGPYFERKWRKAGRPIHRAFYEKADGEPPGPLEK
jgi:hypothetical protein